MITCMVFHKGSPKSHFLECILMGSSLSPQPAGCCRGGRWPLNAPPQFLLTLERGRTRDLQAHAPATVYRCQENVGPAEEPPGDGEVTGRESKSTWKMEEVGPKGGGGGWTGSDVARIKTTISSCDKEMTRFKCPGGPRTGLSTSTRLLRCVIQDAAIDPPPTPLCPSLCLSLMEMTRSHTGDCLITRSPPPHSCTNNPADAIIHVVIWINTLNTNTVRLWSRTAVGFYGIVTLFVINLMIFMRLRREAVIEE